MGFVSVKTVPNSGGLRSSTKTGLLLCNACAGRKWKEPHLAQPSLLGTDRVPPVGAREEEQ